MQSLAPVIRRLFWSLLFVVPLLVLGVRICVSWFVDQELARQGVDFERKEQTLFTISWHNLQKDNSSAERATLSLPDLHLHLEKAKIKRGVTSAAPSSAPSFAASTTPVVANVSVEDLSIEHPHLPPVHGLQGTIYPVLSLANSHLTVDSAQQGLQIRGTLPIQEKYLAGTLTFTLSSDDQPNNLNLSLNNAVLKHPLLGKRIRFEAITAIGSYQAGHLSLKILASPFEAKVHGSVDLSNQQCSLALQSSLSIQDLATVFHVPELTESFDVAGAFNIEADLRYPPLTWAATPSLSDIDFTGHLFSVSDLRFGAISYQPIHSDSSRILGPRSTDWIPYSRLGWLTAAAIAAEDSQFWNHRGINVDGLQMALNALAQGESPPGGSSITQQLAKNIFVDNKRTVYRKIRELLYALALETHLRKEEIITLYLNAVEFGPNIYGVKQAAHAYFLKSPEHLTVVEAAFLASLLPAPLEGYQQAQTQKINRYKINLILDNMYNGKQLSAEELRLAKRMPLHVIPPALPSK